MSVAVLCLRSIYCRRMRRSLDTKRNRRRLPHPGVEAQNMQVDSDGRAEMRATDFRARVCLLLLGSSGGHMFALGLGDGEGGRC